MYNSIYNSGGSNSNNSYGSSSSSGHLLAAKNRNRGRESYPGRVHNILALTKLYSFARTIPMGGCASRMFDTSELVLSSSLGWGCFGFGFVVKSFPDAAIRIQKCRTRLLGDPFVRSEEGRRLKTSTLLISIWLQDVEPLPLTHVSPYII